MSDAAQTPDISMTWNVCDEDVNPQTTLTTASQITIFEQVNLHNQESVQSKMLFIYTYKIHLNACISGMLKRTPHTPYMYFPYTLENFSNPVPS